MSVDHGQAVSYQALKRGTPVYSADEIELGTVRRVDEAAREHIFDGIVIDTPAGTRFIDAPEVRRIAERGVTVSFTAAEAQASYREPTKRMPGGLTMRRTTRWAKRTADRVKNTWDRR